MKNNTPMHFYAKYNLKKKLESEKEVCSEHLSIIAECLRKNQNANNDKSRTKEQLFVIGFSPLDVHKYFNCINKDGNSKWSLKKNIWINDTKIETIKDLVSTLNLNYKHAC